VVTLCNCPVDKAESGHFRLSQFDGNRGQRRSNREIKGRKFNIDNAWGSREMELYSARGYRTFRRDLNTFYIQLFVNDDELGYSAFRVSCKIYTAQHICTTPKHKHFTHYEKVHSIFQYYNNGAPSVMCVFFSVRSRRPSI